MPGFNTIPGSAGGGGAGSLTFVASVYMSTYNRSWAQGGTAGNYGIYSQNQESGYAYFVGTSVTTGVPLNRMQSVTHSFTRIDIIAPSNDIISLYKVKVKPTTEFVNPFTSYNGGIPSFSAPIQSSGNFVLPNNALPLVNVLVNGGGGGTPNTDHCGGGGGGGAVVKLTAYQAVGTTGVVVGAGRGGYNGTPSWGGASYFGNVYALGGGDAGGHSQAPAVNAGNFANGGGGGGHFTSGVAGLGLTQTSSLGLGNTGSPVFHGGFNGGTTSGSDSQQSGGGGGAGSAAAGTAGNNSAPGNGGIGHTSDIITTGSQVMFGGGGRGGRANNNTPASWGTGYQEGYGYGAGGAGYQGSGKYNGNSGIVVVRYYIP
jgi:hypothetical protein